MRAVLSPLGEGKPLEITKDLTLIGRGESCDLRLDHKSVSKIHCVLVRTDGLLVLRDLGSTNGTRVNGQRVRRAALLPNDELGIAGIKFKVLFGEKALPAVSPNELTQRIDADELSELRKKKKTDAEYTNEDSEPSLSVHNNPLPDVYPEDKEEKS
jgi:pSer/pThr/pTyr-binding forkhead associated (FHA) protein